jgi:hypothetical protein
MAYANYERLSRVLGDMPEGVIQLAVPGIPAFRRAGPSSIPPSATNSEPVE